MFSPGPDVHDSWPTKTHQTLQTDGAVFGKKTTDFREVAYIIDQKRGVIDSVVSSNWQWDVKNIYGGTVRAL